MDERIKILICPIFVSIFDIVSQDFRNFKKIAILIPKDIQVKLIPIELNSWNIELLEQNYNSQSIENIKNYNVFFYPNKIKNCDIDSIIPKINSYINTEILK